MRFLLFVSMSISLLVHAEPELTIKQQAESNYVWQQRFGILEKTLSMVPFLVGIIATKYLMKNLEDKEKRGRLAVIGAGIFAALFSEMMIAQSLSQPMMRAFSSSSKWLVSWIPGSVTEETKNPIDTLLIELETLKLEYQQNKCRLSKDTQILFGKLQGSVLIAKAQASMISEQQAATEFLKKQLSPVLSLMRTLLELPQNTQQVILTEELKVKLQPVLNRYSDKIQQDMKRFITSIARSSRLAESSKSVLYLVGEPGTGKTTFVQLFSQAMDLPLINILDIEKALEFKGPLFQYGDMMNESFQLSTLTEMLKKKPKNAILFLDELDKVLSRPMNPMATMMQSVNVQSFLHQLLDPNQKMIKLPDLGIEIDVSGLIIIAAGNEELKSESLRNRMVEVQFPCIESDKRPKIAEKRFATMMKVRPDLQYSEQDADMIRQISAYGSFCGVRSLEFVVDDYVDWKDLQQENWGSRTDFNIAEIFLTHPSSQKQR